ncbi:MAG TPA: delta-60 repeat domain-containing protein [Ilumatobacteraceae bacterium]|nr:delta-60 repeat domain-containing protein [Ilumatobacteraceae bacterium]
MRGTSFGAAMLLALVSVVVPIATASAEPSAGSAHVDRAFGVDGTVALLDWTEVRDLVELPTGDLLVRVARRGTSGAVVAEGIVKLHADGTLDRSFAATSATPGELDLPLDAGVHMLVRADGRIHLDGAVLQYTAAGLPDLTFGNNGRSQFSTGGPDFELADGFVLELNPEPVSLGGLSLQVYSPTGVQDPTRLAFTRLDSNKVIALQRPDGSHLVVAYDSPLAPEPGHLLAIGTDGVLDTSFGGGDGIAALQFAPDTAPGVLFEAALQADGRVVMIFNQAGADPRLRVVRFNPDGSRDTSFGTDGSVVVSAAGGSVVPEPDGRVDLVLHYRFEAPPLDTANPEKTFIVRMLADGTPDRLFNANGLVAGSVTLGELGVSDLSFNARALRLQSGNLLVARTQVLAGGASQAQLVRIGFDAVPVQPPLPPPPAQPQPLAVTGPAQVRLVAPARRLGIVADS